MTTNDGISTTSGAGRNWFLGAAALSFVTTALHVLGGGPEIMDPLYASALPLASMAALDVVWQQVTALLLGGGVAATLAAFRPAWQLPVAWLLGGHYLVIAAIFMVWGVMWFGSPWPMPQWILFLAIAGLMFVGLRFTRR